MTVIFAPSQCPCLSFVPLALLCAASPPQSIRKISGNNPAATAGNGRLSMRSQADMTGAGHTSKVNGSALAPPMSRDAQQRPIESPIKSLAPN